MIKRHKGPFKVLRNTVGGVSGKSVTGRFFEKYPSKAKIKNSITLF